MNLGRGSVCKSASRKIKQKAAIKQQLDKNNCNFVSYFLFASSPGSSSLTSFFPAVAIEKRTYYMLCLMQMDRYILTFNALTLPHRVLYFCKAIWKCFSCFQIHLSATHKILCTITQNINNFHPTCLPLNALRLKKVCTHFVEFHVFTKY